MVFTFERRHTAASLLPSQLVKNHASRVDVVTKLIRVLTHFLYGKHRLQRAKIALLKGIDKSMRKFITGISLVAAPFGQIGAGIVLTVQGSSQGWILAHVLMLASLFLYIAVILGIGQLLGTQTGLRGVLGDSGAILALLGLLLTVSQITIDIAVGLLASTPGEMDQMFGHIRAFPIMEYAFYSIGPSFFFLGFFLLILLLGRFHVIPLWCAGVAAAGIVLGVIGRELNILPDALLAPLALGCIWIGFLPTAWNHLTNRSVRSTVQNEENQIG
jgi:hypothetical protein